MERLLRLSIFHKLLITMLVLTVFACAQRSSDVALSSDSITIEKSISDTREYRYLQLENGLEVLLVEAPESEVTAVSLSVHVGSYHEPEVFPGLAHYLEHMLFLGTESYPEANALQSYLAANAGFANAYTAYDHTNYFFQVPNNQAGGALDRFSEYFKTPLFDPDYGDKERTAVHNEWSMGKSQDARILQQLSGLTANPDHPAARFHVGNEETLPGGDKGLRQAMLDFYQRYYQASNMTLAIVGQASLDELEAEAKKYFGSIRQGDSSFVEPLPLALSHAHQGKHIYYQPQGELRQLVIEFPVANNLNQWRLKPNAYVTNLLSSEEPGTLGHYLREKQLANGVLTEVRANFYGQDGVLRVLVDATQKGMAERDHVVAATLAYLDLIRKEGVKAHYFDEQKALAERNFAKSSSPVPLQQAVQATAFMQYFPVQAVNSFGARFDQFDAGAINAVLDQLQAERMRLWHISENEPVDLDIPYYDGRYSVQNISAKELQGWQAEAATIALALPKISEPESTDKEDKVDNSVQAFTHLIDEPGLDVWFRHAEHHQNGQGFMHYVWNSPLGMTDARHYVLGCMVNGLLQHGNISLITKARRAGIHIAFDRTDDNMQTLTFFGPVEGQAELVRELIDVMSELEVTDDQLEGERDRFSRWIRGESQNPPAQQLQRWLGWHTQGVTWERERLLTEAATITTEELHEYYQQVRKISTLRLYAFGHYAPEQVIDLSRYAEQSLGLKRQPGSIYQQDVHRPESGEHWRVNREISHNDVGWLRAYSHTDTSMQARASWLLINYLINTPLFTQLRTEEQLGYIVGAGIMMMGEHPALMVLLQSYNKPLPEIEARVEKFILEFETQLTELDDAELDDLRSSLIAQLGQKPNGLNTEAASRLGDFYQNQGRFDTLERVIEALEEITLEQLINDYRQLMVERKAGMITLQAKGARFTETPFAPQASP